TSGPVLRIATKHGADAPVDDGSFGVTFPAKPAGAISQPVSWTRLVSVPADGELLLLGCALASPGADWVGAYVVCNTTFLCFRAVSRYVATLEGVWPFSIEGLVLVA